MAPEAHEPVITVSATYGAGGSVIAPRLATELDWPFIDRLISADAVAQSLRSQEGLAHGEQDSTPTGRFLSYFARAATVGAVIGPDPDLEDDTDIRTRTEKALRGLLDGQGGVVLGRAACIVLASRPMTYHVRLDGPVDRRVAWAAPHEGLDLEAARRRQSETDRARTSFVKRLYRTDPANPLLYHLILDPTVIGVDAAVDIIKRAAAAFYEQARS